MHYFIIFSWLPAIQSCHIQFNPGFFSNFGVRQSSPHNLLFSTMLIQLEALFWFKIFYYESVPLSAVEINWYACINPIINLNNNWSGLLTRAFLTLSLLNSTNSSNITNVSKETRPPKNSFNSLGCCPFFTVNKFWKNIQKSRWLFWS